jgi:hypothetical protein
MVNLGFKFSRGRGLLGGSMQTYEIRVLKDNLSTKTVIEQQYFDDDAALRAALRFASGHRFEVWRGLSCIYGVYAKEPRIPYQSTRSAI